MNYKAFGKQIRTQRQLGGLTQEQCASVAGISASFLGHIERGSRKASLETLVSLATVLGCGTDRLLVDSLPHVGVNTAQDLSPHQRRRLEEAFLLIEELARHV